MKPKLLLRLAAVVMLLHIIVSMNFDFAASLEPGWHTTIYSPRSFAGAIFPVFGTLQTLLVVVILWVLSTYSENILTRKLLPFLVVFFVCLAVSEWVYVLPPRAVLSSVEALLVAWAYLRSRMVLKN